MTENRRQKWQLKKMAAGLCQTCGKRSIAKGSRSRCLVCLKRYRIADRKRGGWKPKRLGKAGRPIIKE